MVASINGVPCNVFGLKLMRYRSLSTTSPTVFVGVSSFSVGVSSLNSRLAKKKEMSC